MKLNRTGLNRRPGSRTTHQVQLRSVGGTYCNLRHTHTPGTTDNRKRGFVKHLALHANGKWPPPKRNPSSVCVCVCGGHEGGGGCKMWLVGGRERWRGRESQTQSIYFPSRACPCSRGGGFYVLDLRVYRPVNADQSSQFTAYRTQGKWSRNCNKIIHGWKSKKSRGLVLPAALHLQRGSSLSTAVVSSGFNGHFSFIYLPQFVSSVPPTTKE